MSQDGYSIQKPTTEWEDALVKHQIIQKRPKKKTQDSIDTANMWKQKEKEEHKYDDKTLDELNELEDEIEENILQELRKKRIEEIKQKQLLDRFGRIKQIGKPEYNEEVTESSKQQPVICCLYMHGQQESKILLQCLESLASKFKDCKFLKIIGNECIPNYPDNYCPTLVIYKNGEPVGNIKGLLAFGGKHGISSDVVEWELAQLGIWKTTLEENPRQFKMKKIGRRAVIMKKGENDLDDDFNEDEREPKENDDDDGDLDI